MPSIGFAYCIARTCGCFTWSKLLHFIASLFKWLFGFLIVIFPSGFSSSHFFRSHSFFSCASSLASSSKIKSPSQFSFSHRNTFHRRYQPLLPIWSQ